jgi:hypothetical protein
MSLFQRFASGVSHAPLVALRQLLFSVVLGTSVFVDVPVAYSGVFGFLGFTFGGLVLWPILTHLGSSKANTFLSSLSARSPFLSSLFARARIRFHRAVFK